MMRKLRQVIFREGTSGIGNKDIRKLLPFFSEGKVFVLFNICKC